MLISTAAANPDSSWRGDGDSSSMDGAGLGILLAIALVVAYSVSPRSVGGLANLWIIASIPAGLLLILHTFSPALAWAMTAAGCLWLISRASRKS